MNFRNFKIKSRLAMGFGSMIALMFILGAFTHSEINQLGELTNKLYKHPFTVSTSMLRINGNIVKMHRSMKDVALAKNEQQMKAASNKVSVIEKEVIEDFKMVEERFLGDKSRVFEARDLFINWKPIRDEVIQHMRVGEREQAAEITKAKGAKHVAKLMGATQYLIDYAFNKADVFMENATNVKEDSISVAFSLVAASIIIALILAALITRSVVLPVNEALAIARKVAKGDLSSDIQITSTDEMGQLLAALAEMNNNLNKIVSSVIDSSGSILTGSQQITIGNVNLSQRTEEQAASLEETASSMEEMTATVKQNADSAQEATQLATAARNEAEKGGEVVNRTVTAMSDINASSKKIADIITTIDGIAFQTNLLALNAAVEAARAGDQGRGFAVVASEVRNLAQRSADAAKEVKDLIGDSVEKAEIGTKLVDESGETLQGIVDGTKKVADIISEINAASQEQSSSIDQINKTITQMDDMTQQNASMVEESAAASRSVEDQANVLNGLMQFFNIDGALISATTQSKESTINTIHKKQTSGSVKPLSNNPQASLKTISKKSPGTDTKKISSITDDEWAEF